jgi:hypothetical protein
MNQNEIQLLDTLQRLIVAIERCELNGTKTTDSFMFNIAKDLVKSLTDKEQRAEALTTFVLPEGRGRLTSGDMAKAFMNLHPISKETRFSLLDGIESLSGKVDP